MKESVVNVTGAAQGQAHNGEETREILVPLDFTPCSREALHTAVAYAQRFHARIVLLHVIDIALDFLNSARADVPRLENEIRDQAAEEFAWAISSYKDSGVRFETLIVEGLPAEQILDIAQTRNIFLIIMGKHPSPKRWSLFHRQTVKEVINKAGCEVVVVMLKTHSKTVPAGRERELVH